jgi:hypothetical protein
VGDRTVYESLIYVLMAISIPRLATGVVSKFVMFPKVSEETCLMA